jgi:hypothetical protein
MAKVRKGLDQNELLVAALEGLELQKQRIEAQIAEVRGMLGKRSPRATVPPESPNNGNSSAAGRRELSTEARERIAAAQKKRWKEYRRKKRTEVQG